MKKIFLLLVIAAVLVSCNLTEHLHETGTYTIKDRDGDVTEFYEVKGRYYIVSDTLKKNDKIVINVIKMHPLKRTAKMRTDIARLP